MGRIMAQAEAKSGYRDSQNCLGVYCGKSFTGQLVASRCRPTPDYKNMIFTVELDQAIEVFGEQRNRVEIWTNDSNTLYLEVE